MSRLKYNIFILIIILFGLGSGIYIYKTHYAPEKVDENTEIKIWYVGNNSMNARFGSIIEEYNAIDEKFKTDITVSATGFESYAKLNAELESAEPNAFPDMIVCDADHAALYKDKNYTIKPSEYFDEWNLEGVNQDFLKCASIGKKLIAIPFAADIQMMLVNTDFVADAGNVSSIEELCALSKTYYDTYGKSMFSISGYAEFFRTAMAQLGEEFDAVSPRSTKNENCKYIYKLLAQCAFDRGMSSSADAINDVISGKIPCAIVSSSEIMGHASALNRSIKVYQCPHMEKGEQVYEPEVQCICICKTNTNRQNASAEFIRWFISEDINAKFVSDSGFIPVTASMSAVSSSSPAYSGIKNVISELDSKAKHVNYEPNPEYVANYAEFMYVMQLVMESLS